MIRVQHWYTKTEIDAILKAAGPDLDALQVRGYVLQMDTDTTRFRFVKPFGERKRIVREGHFGELAPIVKRTQAQRTESLLKAWIKDCLANGRVPGLDDEKMKEIVGASWSEGRGMTAEDVKVVAQHFLERAAKEQQEHHDRHYWAPARS
jgi:hypothetical protein